MQQFLPRACFTWRCILAASFLQGLLPIWAETPSCNARDGSKSSACGASSSSGCGVSRHCSQLPPGEWLANGEWLSSPSGKYVAILEGEQLKIHGAGSSDALYAVPQEGAVSAPLSAARTVGGKLVLEDASGQTVWSSSEYTFWFRFTVLSTRGPSMGMQFSEFSLWQDGVPLSWVDAVATSGANGPDHQSPRETLDGQLDTKWFAHESNSVSMVVKLPRSQPIPPDHFSFTTGDDVPERDPMTWFLEGSLDGESWTLMHYQQQPDSTPMDRLTSTERFDLLDSWKVFVSGHASLGDGVSSSSFVVLSDDGTLAVRNGDGHIAWSVRPAEPSLDEQLDPEVEHMKEMTKCSKLMSCKPCIEGGCAWCVAKRQCVSDKAWICQGQEDHVSPPGPQMIGQASCPEREEVEEGHRLRRERQAASQLAAPESSGSAGTQHIDVSDVPADAREAEHDSGDDGPEIDAALIKELQWRARFAEEEKGAKPYEVLKVRRDASASVIRKAYRRFSMKFHPDKWARAKKELRLKAETAFADLTKAYETVGNPDKRAAFDDGVEFDSSGQHDENFYFGDPLIATLTEELWERRLTGTSVWLIEFYAAWCPACRNSRHVWTDIARKVEHLPVEVGAVNCVRQRRICGEYVGVTSYPSIKLINREFGTMQDYKGEGLHSENAPEQILQWVEKVAKEWQWLFHNSKVHRGLGPKSFLPGGVVAESESMWIVSFMDGLECPSCKAVSTNLFRLSASLRGLPVSVGVVDCSEPELREFCYEEHQVPEPPHRPLTKAWRAGPKNVTDQPVPGEVLYGAAELEPHVAFMLVEKVARLSLADRLAPDALVTGKASFDAEPEDPENEPPPPPPGGGGSHWEEMPELNWDQSGISDRRALPQPWQTWNVQGNAQITR